MSSIILWLIGGILLLLAFLILYLKRVPHGWVQLRTGIVLKFLPALDSQQVVELRDSLEAFVKKQHPKISKTLPVEEVKDISIPTRHGQIPARVFDNNHLNPTHNIVFIHGGGWCVGSVNSYEEICRRLTLETNLPVIALDYSLAPEYKFPHAHEECLDAVSYISAYADVIEIASLPLILVGDSAGGNLVISTYYDSIPKVKSMIKKMIPVYPAVDGIKSDYYSSISFAKGYYLTAKSMAQFTEALINTADDLKDPRLSPIYQQPRSDFPETFVITAEFDPLRDQAESFAAKMRTEGNDVILKRYKETIHAFFGIKDFGTRGVEAITDINKFISGKKIDGLKSFS